MTEYDWDNDVIADWLLDAFVWVKHPFGHNFWRVEYEGLLVDKPLSKKAQTELDKMLRARKAFLSKKTNNPYGPGNGSIQAWEKEQERKHGDDWRARRREKHHGEWRD